MTCIAGYKGGSVQMNKVIPSSAVPPSVALQIELHEVIKEE